MKRKKQKQQTLAAYFLRTSYISIIFSVLIISISGAVLSGINSYRYVNANLQTIVEQKSRNIESNMQLVESNIRNTVYNTELQNVMNQYRMGAYTNLNEVKIRVNEIATNLTLFFAQAENVLIYGEDGTMIGNKYAVVNGNAQDTSWYETVQNSHLNTLWLTDLGYTINMNGKQVYVCQVVSKVRARDNSVGAKVGSLLGYVVVEFRFEDVGLLLQSEQQSYETYLISGEGIVLASSQPSFIGQTSPALSAISVDSVGIRKYDDAMYAMTAERVKLSNASWRCICMTPSRHVFVDMLKVIGLPLCLALIVLISAYYANRRNAAAVTAVFDNLRRNFARIENGQWNEPIIMQTHITEIAQISQQFNHMAMELDDTIKKLLDAQLRKQELMVDFKKAELMNLQMQINPHFLYNTLDTINWTALGHGQSDVSEMVIALGKLLRSSIDQSASQTTIRQELERVELYMYLQGKRFGERLGYQVHAQPEILGFQIPGLLVQPLVENAIQHGVAPYSKRGEITVQVNACGNSICVRVADNGKGMSQEKLDSLRKMWRDICLNADVNVDTTASVGLHNIMKRLWLLYGQQTQVRIESSEDGTVVCLSYPMSPSSI